MIVNIMNMRLMTMTTIMVMMMMMPMEEAMTDLSWRKTFIQLKRTLGS